MAQSRASAAAGDWEAAETQLDSPMARTGPHNAEIRLILTDFDTSVKGGIGRFKIGLRKWASAVAPLGQRLYNAPHNDHTKVNGGLQRGGP